MGSSLLLKNDELVLERRSFQGCLVQTSIGKARRSFGSKHVRQWLHSSESYTENPGAASSEE